MKTTLILSTIVMLLAWAGCSDNMNPTEPSNSNNIIQNQQPNTLQKPPVMLWSLDEFKIWAENEALVEKSVTYTNQISSLAGNSSYMISFNASWNADPAVNGYVPKAEVSKDGELICNVTGIPDGGSPVPYQIEFSDAGNFEIQFYIGMVNKHRENFAVSGEDVYVELTDIQIYKTR